MFQVLHHTQRMLFFMESLVLYFQHLTFRQLCGVILVPIAGASPGHFTCMAAGAIGEDTVNTGALHPSGHPPTSSPQFNAEKPGDSVQLKESVLYSEIPK